MRHLFTLILVVSCPLLWAAPAMPGWRVFRQPDGSKLRLELRGDEFYSYWADEQGRIVERDSTGYWRVVDMPPTANQLQAHRAASPLASQRTTAGKHRDVLPVKGLVILVNFQDVKFQSANTQDAMQQMMSADKYTYMGATGSAKKYFSDQSFGQYQPDFKVVGPVTVAHDVAYYGQGKGGSSGYAAEMVLEACKLVDDVVDFNEYKQDNYNVDYVYVIFAGYQENEGADVNTIWAHSWNVQTAYNQGHCNLNPSATANKVDGLKVGSYACSSELRGYKGTNRSGIGTFCHEFSHVLGLPDLYDSNGETDGDATAYCPGYWSPMSSGNYLNNSRTPCGYSVYDKYFLGWIQPKVITQAGRYDLLVGNSAYMVNSAGTQKGWNATDEWVYYLENRQCTGWDKYIPGHGMLIWKVNYRAANWTGNKVNAFSAGVRCSIVAADDTIISRGDASDAFPGESGVDEWTRLSAYPIYDIMEHGDTISFSLKEHYTPPTPPPTPPTSLPDAPEYTVPVAKMLLDGRMYIFRGNRYYDLLGR